MDGESNVKHYVTSTLLRFLVKRLDRSRPRASAAGGRGAVAFSNMVQI